MNFKHELDMVKFAFENGFTEYKRIIQPNNDVAYVGTWGSFILADELEIVAIDAIIKHMLEKINQMNEVDSTEVIETLELTSREAKVLKAIVQLSANEEYGLPVWNEEVQKYCGIKGKTYSGVISSLFKKGYLESYLENRDPSVQDEFYLTEEMYIKLVDPSYKSY